MIVIGDIHGCLKTLKKVVEAFPSEEFCIVGDLVDRGPSSVEVVQYVMANRDRIKCVKGNHEEMMIEFYKNGGRPRFGDIWLANGGEKVYKAYDYKYPKLLQPHLEFLEALPYYIEFPELKDQDGRYLVVSHSVIINKNIERCVENQSIIWGRRFPDNDVSEGKWFNIFGHTPIAAPEVTNCWANIDTGCVFVLGLGHMTAMQWPSKELFSFRNSEIQMEANR